MLTRSKEQRVAWATIRRKISLGEPLLTSPRRDQVA